MKDLSARADSYKGDDLVFIVGCPRSGTTWLQRLLAAHPKIKTGQEPSVFSRYVGPQLRRWRWELAREGDPKTATGRGAVGLSCYFQEQEFIPILKDYMRRLLGPMTGGLQPGELFLDKTPGNTRYLAEISELLPEGRFIHIVRDPRDTVASLLGASRSWGSGWAPRTAKAAIKMWIKFIKAADQASRKLPARLFLEIRYETLLAEPEDTLLRIADFLHLEWRREEVKKAVETNRAQVVKEGGGTPIHIYGEAAKRLGAVVKDPAAFIGSARHGAWKQNLSLSEKFVVWRTARKLTRRMGYGWSWRDWIG